MPHLLFSHDFPLFELSVLEKFRLPPHILSGYPGEGQNLQKQPDAEKELLQIFQIQPPALFSPSDFFVAFIPSFMLLPVLENIRPTKAKSSATDEILTGWIFGEIEFSWPKINLAFMKFIFKPPTKVLSQFYHINALLSVLTGTADKTARTTHDFLFDS